MVLVILADTTWPTFSVLRVFRSFCSCCSAIAYFPRFFLTGSGAVSGCNSRSRSVVKIRARSLRSVRSFFKPSVCPIAIWNRSRNICSRASVACFFSSALSSSRTLSAFISSSLPAEAVFARDHLGGDGQLLRCQAHCFSRDLSRNAFHFKKNLARPDHAHPLFRRALAFTHTGFSRFLGDRLVRKHSNPNLAAALDRTRHSDTSRFDLPVGDPAALQRLQTVVAERQAGPAPGLSGHAAALLFAKFHLFGHQHGYISVIPVFRPSAVRPSAFR